VIAGKARATGRGPLKVPSVRALRRGRYDGAAAEIFPDAGRPQTICQARDAHYIAVMGDIVNLKLARKRKAREAAETEAAAKRLQHGQSKAQKKLSEAEQEAAERKLDGHKRDDS
jgi:acetyl-CoA carboxylase carboxyltransferase component